jgi:sugar phosphate isomerase/epimerase
MPLPFFSLHAGHALELGLDEKGQPKGAARSREQALDRLAISLDRLANLADNLHMELLLENAAGRRTPTGRAAFDPDAWSLALFQEPSEIDRTLTRVAAPKVGVLLDVAHLLIACHARRWEPEPVLEELQPWVRAIELSGTDSLHDLHRLPKHDGTEVQLARLAGGLALPLFFEPHDVPKAELLAYITELESSLAAGPKHHTVERK